MEMNLFTPLVLLALFIPLSLVIYDYWIKTLLEDAKMSEEKMTLQESVQNI